MKMTFARLLIVSACLLACGGSHHHRTMPAAGQRSSKLVLVTVMSARIASKTGGTDGWDTPEPQDQEKRTAEGLGTLLQLVPETAAAGAVLKTLAQLAPVREPGADAAYP